MTERELTAVGGDLDRLAAEGVSPWLDGAGRRLLASGGLADLVRHRGVRGARLDAAVLAASPAGADDAYDEYAGQLRFLAHRDVRPDAALQALIACDARWACDDLLPVYEATRGREGHVSADAGPDPRPADAEALVRAVNRPNILVKIPATSPTALETVRACIGRRIGVHVTEIFSLRRYGEVADAYTTGLEHARAAGHSLSGIASVAELPVGRIGTEVDRLLARLGTPQARALRGEAGRAAAQMVYDAYEERLGGDRWASLAASGAVPQTVMWSGVRCVERYVAWGTAVALPLGPGNGICPLPLEGDTLSGREAAGRAVWGALGRLGVSYGAVCRTLEDRSREAARGTWRRVREAVGEPVLPVSETVTFGGQK
ncbi:transaldolase [Streptomyces sp. ET3-23]|uniref:transaldolase family protein n=1 Tax=Streptomyces sp. ET3-23 TaxID=2885643 RepID=UPI001D10EBA0|nr:transaldolase family protein [Streptomyces sp. ET3-23]MCC2274853.1 transaldolase [Streptomyces sp. ET3-23]